MERNKKTEYVSKLRQEFNEHSVAVLINQSGLTVAEVEVLRKKMHEDGGKYRVVKGTLTRIALQGTQYEELAGDVKGPVGVIFSNNSVEAARIIVGFAEKSDGKVTVISGGVDGKRVDASYINMLSKLPTLDEARAKIIAVIQTPGGQIARVLKAYSEK